MSGKFILLDCPIFNCVIISGDKSEGISRTLVTLLFSKDQIKQSLDSQKLYDWLRQVHISGEEYVHRNRLDYSIKLINNEYRIIFEISNDRINIEQYLDEYKNFLIKELSDGSGLNGFKTEIVNGFYLTFMI